jgi:hypothetical protein
MIAVIKRSLWDGTCAVTRQIAQHTKKKRIITKAGKDESTKGIGHIERVEFQLRFTGNLVQGFCSVII